ncbi:snare associated Golgi protein-domain-containing protein [Suillus ampliporus]|nr:snare associated Golgi protein-domain-containing protein [Suillus ampliporus]
MNDHSNYAASPYSSPYTTDVNPYNQPARRISRTPSPTPSEIQALDQKGFFNWGAMLDKKRFVYISLIIAAVVGALFIFYHDQIVRAIQPAANWMHNFKFGFLIPIAIFFVISFPPLFGHEILAIVCGLVWGVWIGFAITAAGTFIGEIGNFYAFRYLCKARGEKMEKGNIIYSSLGRVVREGGFKVALIARYSAIPGHFTTAIFAVCGMNIFVFMLAAALSLPKQFITVYIGTLLETSATSTTSSKNKIISDVVGVITVLVTIVAMWYITRQVNRVKPQIIYERRKARQAKLEGESGSLYQNGGATTSAVFNPSETTLAPYDPPYQQWDSEGHAVGYAADPHVYAPQPKKPDNPFTADMTPTMGTKPLRHESTDTVGWELQTNAAQGQSYPLSAVTPEPLRNPYDDKMGSEPAVVSYPPPAGLPPSSAAGGYTSYTPPLGPPPSSTAGGFASYAPPAGPPPPSAAGGYAFGARPHSFAGGPGTTSPPPPPSYGPR